LKYPLAQLTRLWGKLFLGIDVDTVSPVQAAAKIKIPVLLIHSTNDPVIPYEHAQTLQQALKNNRDLAVYVHDESGHGARSAEMNQIELNFLAKHCEK
jgi:dipeptidyl aminopeptidase/acylaminoacyl peptidase